MTTDMIVKELPRLRDTPLAEVTILIPQTEELRRDNVIKALLRPFFFYTGQRVRPIDEETFKTAGYARIIGIADTYQKYKGTDKKVEWPEHDNPMLLAATYENNNFTVNATVDYFKAA